MEKEEKIAFPPDMINSLPQVPRKSSCQNKIGLLGFLFFPFQEKIPLGKIENLQEFFSHFFVYSTPRFGAQGKSLWWKTDVLRAKFSILEFFSTSIMEIIILFAPTQGTENYLFLWWTLSAFFYFENFFLFLTIKEIKRKRIFPKEIISGKFSLEASPNVLRGAFYDFVYSHRHNFLI